LSVRILTTVLVTIGDSQLEWGSVMQLFVESPDFVLVVLVVMLKLRRQEEVTGTAEPE